MTTIAWDGTTLAGDTLGVIGDTLKVFSIKIFQLLDGRLFGGSGRFDEVLAVREWLNGKTDKPTVDHFAGILVETPLRYFRLEEQLVQMPMHESFHAIGSGRDFAMAALSLGRSAKEAVALAAKWDVWTGGQIVTLTFESHRDVRGRYAPKPVSVQPS